MLAGGAKRVRSRVANRWGSSADLHSPNTAVARSNSQADDMRDDGAIAGRANACRASHAPNSADTARTSPEPKDSREREHSEDPRRRERAGPGSKLERTQALQPRPGEASPRRGEAPARTRRTRVMAPGSRVDLRCVELADEAQPAGPDEEGRDPSVSRAHRSIGPGDGTWSGRPPSRMRCTIPTARSLSPSPG